MQRILLFVLTLQFLSGNIVGEELLKMPYLVRHFQAHQTRRPNDTWFDFLRLHYANTRHRNSDPVHRQLPLQSISGSNLAFLLPAPNPYLEFRPGAGVCYCPAPFADETLLPSDFRVRVLRPPRF